MSTLLDYMRLCRLCLVKDKVNVPIFGGTSDVRQIFLKITACLPVKVSQDDNLPKNICDSCLYKVDLLYQFWNTTVNAEKQLITWLEEIGVDVNIKSSQPPPLQAMPQSHAHPHSITGQETLVLKEERPDSEIKEVPNVYGYDLSYGPQVDMTVGAPQDFTQSDDAPMKQETKPATRTPAKRRGRPPKQKSPAAGGVTITPVVPATSSATPAATTSNSNSKRRSSAAAAAARVAAAVANEESDDSDIDDRLGGDDDSDEDMDVTVAKEEADSEDDDYGDNPEGLEPTAFVGVPSTSADAEQPGPSGLGGGTTTGKIPTTAASTGTESGQSFYEDLKFSLKDPIQMEPIVTIVELPATTNWKITRRKRVKSDDENDSDYQPLITPKKSKAKLKQKKINTKLSKSVSRNLGSQRKIKVEGYKNPFVYDHLNTANKKPTEERKSKTTTKWTCLICSENLTGKKDLIEHYAAHKEDKIKVEEGTKLAENEVYQCEVCLKEFTSEKRFEKHAEAHNDSRFNCEYCEKSFKRPYEFAVHMRFHSNDDKLKCHVCDYTTTYNSSLKTHIKRHESEYKYKCELCGKGFFVYTWFEEHKNFHTGDKPFGCEVCGKQFAYTRYLTAHKRSMHPETFGTQPIINECQFCQKRFAHKKSLLLHVRGHTGENTVLCDICGKRLSSNDHLKLHRRIHTGYKPYKCATCGKGFSKKCNLTLHERVHSGEKPYVCDVCGKCFSQRSTLVIHTRYHTGSRPYICHLCNKGFVAKGVLGIHLKSCNRQNIIGNYLIEPFPKRE